MNDRTITLTWDEFQEVEAALEDRLTNFGRASNERAFRRAGESFEAKDAARADRESALRKVRSA